MTYEQFCTQHGIQIVSTRTLSNPHMPDVKTAPMMHHWHVLLTYAAPVAGGMALRSMKLHYSKGTGHRGEPPTAAEVIESLASEAQVFGPDVQGPSFPEWVANCGLNEDSMRAYRAYQASKGLARRLRGMLGQELYNWLAGGQCEERIAP
ncbi:MAG: hypothetical protein WC729_29925 [Sphingomonas sp.]|jgi:hypothetical protein|uniref:hypothetical protein n=1 Tax=Sphingomonas sp. TaxID=28214 RepID=UPI003565FB98